VSIYDPLGKAARAKRDAIERVICRAAAVSYLRADVILLRSLERGDLISLHQRFDVEAVMRDIEVKAGDRVSRRAYDVDRDCKSSRSGEPRSVVAGQLRIGRRAAAGRRSPGFFERKTNMKLKSGWA